MLNFNNKYIKFTSDQLIFFKAHLSEKNIRSTISSKYFLTGYRSNRLVYNLNITQLILNKVKCLLVDSISIKQTIFISDELTQYKYLNDYLKIKQPYILGK